MIDFACKKFDIDEVVKCGLGLSRTDFRLLKFLVENQDSFTTGDLAKKLGVDKSTIQRSVKKLHGKGLVSRGQINQSVGGYVFTYRVKDREKIREMVWAIIDGWEKNVKKRIVNW